MGGCYSCASHKALASPLSKQPRDRWIRLSRKGSYRTSNKNAEHSQGRLKRNSNASAEDAIIKRDRLAVLGQHVPEEVSEERGVVPSDSGVESLGCPQEDHVILEADGSKSFTLCRSCHQKLKRLTWSSCHQCDKFRIDPEELSALVNDTYCTCGPRQHGKPSSCKTHSHRSRTVSAVSPHKSSSSTIAEITSDQNKRQGNHQYARISRQSPRGMDSLNCDGDKNRSDIHSDVSYHAPLAAGESADDQLDDPVKGNSQCPAAFLASGMNLYSEILREVDCICKCDIPAESSQDLHPLAKRKSCGPMFTEGESQVVADTLYRLLSSSARSSPARSAADTDHQSLAIREEEDDDDSGHGISKLDYHPGSVSELEVDEGEEIVEDGAMSSSHSTPLRYVGIGQLMSKHGHSRIAFVDFCSKCHMCVNCCGEGVIVNSCCG